MIKELLRPEVQKFICDHHETSLTKLALSKSPFPDVSLIELVEQVEGWQKAKEKLPTWCHTKNILFPQRVSMEQCSSELSAQYKTSIVDGKSLLDITGGFGVDDVAFSKKIEKITYCEHNQKLNELSKHNFNILSIKNIDCIACDAIDFLKQNPSFKYDWIYADPSRRDENGNRVYALKDCTPDIASSLPLIFKHTQNVLLKLSPMLDITQVMNELNGICEVHVVAVKNEVREVLYVLQQNFSSTPKIHAVNLVHNNQEVFKFTFEEEKNDKPIFSDPKHFLYEPNSAILKAGAFNSVCKTFNINKLNRNSHLYTSDILVNHFQGRKFKILKVLYFGKQSQREISNLEKANISVRNFPQSVEELRNKYKIKAGGEDYLFFTTLYNEKKAIIFCRKINS